MFAYELSYKKNQALECIKYYYFCFLTAAPTKQNFMLITLKW